MGFGKDGKGQILYDYVAISPGALAARDVISSNVQTNLTEDFRILKTEYFINYLPADSNQAPLLIGMCAGGIDGSEVEQTLEASPNDSSDVPESEQVLRPVWPLENLQVTSFTGTNEVSPIGRLQCKGSFTPKWTMPNAGGWFWWVYNLHDSAALTTGDKIIIFAKHYGVWVR